MTVWTRRGAGAAAISLGLVGCAGGAPAPAPGDVASDRRQRGRLIAPVRINGEGPFDFVIDSAANASVIAADLANALGLPAGGDIAMHTLIAREIVGTVVAARIQTGALDAAGAKLALASRRGLDGAAGLIGTDLLEGLRLDLRFRGATGVRVTHSRGSGRGFFDIRPAQTRLIRAVQQRFGGQLMIEARVGGAPVLAVLDTGAQVSVGNPLLAAIAGARPIVLRDGSRRGEVLSPTGRTAPAVPMMLSSLRFGGASIGELPLLIGEFHTFDLWGIADRPAMLMGVDVLGAFNRVLIDLGRGEAVFEI